MAMPRTTASRSPIPTFSTTGILAGVGPRATAPESPPIGPGYISRTGTASGFSLIQQNQPGPVPDPQWPFLGGSNFGVNPINGNQIIISSQAGRIFRTRDQGRTWGVIADPATLDSTYAPAQAFGAPDPANPTNNQDD